MLPRAAYLDPAVFGWEQQYFFAGGWNCVGHSSQVAKPGEQRAEPVGQGSVLLVRGDDGELRAFANTCRHRGHELLACGAAVLSDTLDTTVRDPEHIRKVLGTDGFVVESERSQAAAAGAAGGRPPLLYRRGHAATLHPPLLRPAEPQPALRQESRP